MRRGDTMRYRAECRHPTTHSVVEVVIEAASEGEAVGLLGRMEFAVERVEAAGEPAVSADAEALRMTLRSIRDEVRGVKRAVAAVCGVMVVVLLLVFLGSVVPM